jgi:uncharacterized tellurite resistance protein B-like protein
VDARQNEIARSLFQLAWADGEIDPREVVVISGLLERMGVPMVERLAAMDQALAENTGARHALVDLIQDRQERMTVLGMLVQVCFADQQTHPEEVRILGELAMQWGVSAQDLEQLRLQASRGQ